MKSGCTLAGSVTLGESLSSVPQRLQWLRKGPAPGFRGRNALWPLPATLCRGVLRLGHSVEVHGSSSMRPRPGRPFGCLAMLLLPSLSPPVPSKLWAEGPSPKKCQHSNPTMAFNSNNQLTPQSTGDDESIYASQGFCED